MTAIFSIISMIISVGIGIFACLYVQLQEQDIQIRESVPAWNVQCAVKAIKRISLLQWIGIVTLAVVGGVAVYFLLNYEVAILSTARVIAAMCMLYVAAIIDGNIRKIPNAVVLFGILCGVVLLIVEAVNYTENIYGILISCIGAMAGFGFFFLLLSVITKHGIGMGDVKMMAALGFLMGLSGTFYTLLFGMLVCLIAAIVLLVFRKKKMKDSVPFGPFIYIGCCLAVIFGTF